MASYRVLYWQDIPSQVEAIDADGTIVRRQLPASFQQHIDRVAMAEGLIDSDAYLEAWSWSDPGQREGRADDVAPALVEELVARWRAAKEP